MTMTKEEKLQRDYKQGGAGVVSSKKFKGQKLTTYSAAERNIIQSVSTGGLG